MGNLITPEFRKGFFYLLPPEITGKVVSSIQVGPFHEVGLAAELNKFFGLSIEDLWRINQYILVHSQGIQGLEQLVQGKPFVDPVIQRASLNSPLITELGIDYDHVLHSMLRPGTSDAQGNIALQQALLALGQPLTDGDQGFFARQYFLKGKLTLEEVEAVSAFLANPELMLRYNLSRADYQQGFQVQVPIVTLKPETKVERFDVANMSDQELLELNAQRKLAASLEELHQFRDMYRDKKFLEKRGDYGLDHHATDIEIETWFGLRSEHCFHKEFNACITLADLANDPIFAKALAEGFLSTDADGNYVLGDGLFKIFIEAPARAIHARLVERGRNWIASMFDDNSGVVFYDQDYMFCIKFETHNSPSNKEPIQGAKTGIDGVNRDIFGTMLGTFDAIANFFFYCTGDPSYAGWLPRGVKHPYVILKGITQGVREGGNESQIPTLGGGIITDPRYMAKCLVYCGTVGWSPVCSDEGRSYLVKNPQVDDIVLVAGQPVGIDGVHGATESSLSAGAHISLGHVQADFSFIQAKLKQYLLEVARARLLSSVTDFGAMGLGSAAIETARATNGLELDLALHPVKYQGIQPWQVIASETQDRMLLVARPDNLSQLLEKAGVHDVEVAQLGRLTDTGYVHLTYNGKSVALIDIDRLFDKEPRKRMYATWTQRAVQEEISIRGCYSLEESLCMVMQRPDVASKEWFFRQKDSGVKGGTIQGPLIGLEQAVEADATIQKPLETEGRDYGAIAYALGIAPKLCDIDPYFAAQRSFIDMVGKIIALGGALPDMQTPQWDAWAVCGNYCQPNSDANTTLASESGEHNLAALIREGIAVRECVEKFGIPVISGKDSMKCSCRYEVDESFQLEVVPPDLRKHITLIRRGDKRFIEIHNPPTYLASAAVKIEDYRKCVNTAFKQAGDLIYIVGTTGNHLGASQYLQAIGYREQGTPLLGGICPQADLDEFVEVAHAVHAVIDQELVASCSYIHNGGLAVAVAKAAMAGQLGASINLGSLSSEILSIDERLLYSETPGRFIITIAPQDKESFEKLLGQVPYYQIGTVVTQDIHITRVNGSKESLALQKIKSAYQGPLSFSLQEVKDG
ncbi:hypothetical protein JW930_05960 [Candidatus Woesearchaeota archaeon]|nr:hypothetical protein [Candidatus Woesearchaeota archaeon]